MKRSVLLISAFAVFGLLFTQCKKNQEVLPVIPSGEKIDVTLNVPNNGGSKTSIADDGTIVWTGNDKIVVCYSGGSDNLNYKGVVGILSITNNVNTNVATFTGQITLMGDQTAENFASYFYDFHYLGTNFKESDIKTGETYTNKYTLDFTNQDGTLEGLSKLHYAMGTGSFKKNVDEKWTANLVLENKICVFSYDVTAMVDSNNEYAVDNFYMTFPNTAPNTKLTVGFTGGYTYDNTTKSIYLGKPTKQGERYKFYVILPGYNQGTEPSVDVQFFSDSYSQNAAITHPSAYFGYNSYNGGTSTNVTTIGSETIPVTYMLDNCARGIFKTATGRLIRFAKGNLKTYGRKYPTQYVANFSSSFHLSQVEGYTSSTNTLGYFYDSSDNNKYFDIYAFGASGHPDAKNSKGEVIKPSSLYIEYETGSKGEWYYNGYNLSNSPYDFGNMAGLPEGFHTMTTDDFSAFDGFYKNNTIYNESSFLPDESSSSKFPSSNYVLVITKESPSSDEIASIKKTQVPVLEKKYNAIFFINSGYSLRVDANGSVTVTWEKSPTYYWIADGVSDGENNHLRVMNGNGVIEEYLDSECYSSGAAVRLVRTEFDPNSSN